MVKLFVVAAMAAIVPAAAFAEHAKDKPVAPAAKKIPASLLNRKPSLKERGVVVKAFDAYLAPKVVTQIDRKGIAQTDGDFSLFINLSKWDGLTSPEQIVTLSRLFWEVYPAMHKRFGAAGKSPKSVTLAIENEGYAPAWAGGGLVHLHDKWLGDNRIDYDCITHELAHVIQNGWDGKFLEYDGYIERFADACRAIYAFEGGRFNRLSWRLQTIKSESTRESSVRFLVWMDKTYSTPEIDLLLKFFIACYSKKYPANEWKNAWADIFKGSKLEGRDIEDVYGEYATSDYANGVELKPKPKAK